MADQDTPIPGVETFQKLTQASVLRKGSHALDFITNEKMREIVEASARNWLTDHVVALFDNGLVQVYTEEQWAQRQKELFEGAELAETLVENRKIETQVFELGEESERGVLAEWAKSFGYEGSELLAGVNVGDIVVRRASGTFQVYADKARQTASAISAKNREMERAHLRLGIFQSSMEEPGKSRLEVAKEVEEWILGV